jgi:hypothetical protein
MCILPHQELSLIFFFFRVSTFTMNRQVKDKRAARVEDDPDEMYQHNPLQHSHTSHQPSGVARHSAGDKVRREAGEDPITRMIAKSRVRAPVALGLDSSPTSSVIGERVRSGNTARPIAMPDHMMSREEVREGMCSPIAFGYRSQDCDPVLPGSISTRKIQTHPIIAVECSTHSHDDAPVLAKEWNPVPPPVSPPYFPSPRSTVRSLTPTRSRPSQ